MKPSELVAAESREWIVKAILDLRSARVLLDAGLVGPALFHCQQSVEKSLKGFLTWHGVLFRRVHDLEEIGDLCVSIQPELASMVKQVELLTIYAWKLRYPGEIYEPALNEGEEGITLAKLALDEIQRRIPENAPS